MLIRFLKRISKIENDVKELQKSAVAHSYRYGSVTLSDLTRIVEEISPKDKQNYGDYKNKTADNGQR